MTRVAHSPKTSITPTAAVPEVSEPICDDFAVRISSGAAANGALEGVPECQWVGHLRRISAAKLRVCGLTPLMDDAKLLVSELVTNALRYGRGAEVEFRLVITLQGLLLAVNDGSDRRPRLEVAGSSSETGRGLFLVAALADDWAVSPDGTTTWCTLSLAGASR
ncbi:Anti-sigma regulatory factor (Ser/Thr protein kinase) [Actinacidiphila yanglinensis]|uniref:Anti-sigma regulatory factor (Ser/Thr protein kinase) n=1 Tax=Actinacidiphila yanglinensis TaxID=310779 RepID=A0A1H6DKI0_9ACTN|nr:ATP-binding protein [Actinacidiphila yanglinensis]SEG85782.1 Anti-sigma regulatory factor (Ser/Thr protein kinase) [Actinacidiphila yanglinensis]